MRWRRQRDAHRQNFNGQVEQISEKYLRINGRLSADAVELFGVCRELVADLVNDSLLVGQGACLMVCVRGAVRS